MMKRRPDWRNGFEQPIENPSKWNVEVFMEILFWILVVVLVLLYVCGGWGW